MEHRKIDRREFLRRAKKDLIKKSTEDQQEEGLSDQIQRVEEIMSARSKASVSEYCSYVGESIARHNKRYGG